MKTNEQNIIFASLGTYNFINTIFNGFLKLSNKDINQRI